MYETPYLETDRLILKRGKLDDYNKVYEYDFTKLRDINGEFELVKQDLNKIANYAIPIEGEFDWIVYLKDTNEPIGNIVADREIEELKSIELSYNTHPNYWKKGYTYEALSKLIEWLFENGYENIIAGYDEGNTKSKNLIKKLGFMLLKVKPNSWEKDGKSITTYYTILSKRKHEILKNINSSGKAR